MRVERCIVRRWVLGLLFGGILEVGVGGGTLVVGGW